MMQQCRTAGYIVTEAKLGAAFTPIPDVKWDGCDESYILIILELHAQSGYRPRFSSARMPAVGDYQMVSPGDKRQIDKK